MELADFASKQTVSPTPCKVCGEDAVAFDVLDFLKSCAFDLYPQGLSGIPVYYHRCGFCNLIFTRFFDAFEPGDWTRYVYNAGYAAVDPPYLDLRPRADARRLDALLCARKTNVIGLDYGGGAGLATSLLRGLGYRYDAWDPFGAQSITPELRGQHNFCSSFEVAEHSPDPVGMFQGITGLMTQDRIMIFVGTQTSEGMVDDARRLSWWYAAPRNGHITLHTKRSLRIVAKSCALDFHTFSRSTHLMTRGYSAAEVASFVYLGTARRKARAAMGIDPLR